jgi:hypothetical protein
MSIGMGQFFPSGYGYGFMCPLGTLPTAIPTCYAAFHDQEWGAPVHDDKYALNLTRPANLFSPLRRMIRNGLKSHSF